MAEAVSYSEKWPEVRMQLERAIAGAIRTMTESAQVQILHEITEANLVDTGNYRRSWTWTLSADGKTGEVGSPVEYGPYLEYGYHQRAGQLYPKTERNRVVGWGRTSGKFIAGRPHVRPAARKVVAKANQIFGTSFRETLR